MHAKDIMTTPVVTVHPETPVREVAQLLIEHGVGAVPVVDAAGAPMGMVSDGDLIGRDLDARLARRAWWLDLVAEDGLKNEPMIDRLKDNGLKARQVMTAPIVTVGPETPLDEIVQLLETHHIKRLPVVDDSRVVGVISRNDLLRALMNASHATVPAEHRTHHLFHHGQDHAETHPAVAPAAPPPSAAAFRAQAEQFEREKRQAAAKASHASGRHVDDALRSRFTEHIDEAAWRQLLESAAAAARQGASEQLLVRFPSALCRDGGRAINALEPDWSFTLTGKAADVFLRWQRELRPQGFGLSARMLDFQGGFPGDVGLFLTWKG